MTGVSIVNDFVSQSGRRLQENYRSLMEDIAQDDIDLLASSRSFSVASMATSRPPSEATSRPPSEATTPSSESRSLDSCLAPSIQVSEFTPWRFLACWYF